MSSTILPEPIKQQFLSQYEHIARNHALNQLYQLSLDKTVVNRGAIRNFLQKVGYLPPVNVGGLGGDKPEV